MLKKRVPLADPRAPLRLDFRGSTHCQAARDGDCDWKLCPQERDGEPSRSGRHCPLDDWKESD